MRPARRRRQQVLVAGWLLNWLGLLLIARFALPVDLRLLLGISWGAIGGRELIQFGRAQRDVRELRLYADGRAEALLPGAAREPLAWLEDGLILGSLAWLRFRRSDGRLHCELLLRCDVDKEAWRRLKVLGRYAGPGGVGT